MDGGRTRRLKSALRSALRSLCSSPVIFLEIITEVIGALRRRGCVDLLAGYLEIFRMADRLPEVKSLSGATH